MERLNILGICGSLRAASYNRSALRLAAACMPEGMHLMDAEIGGIPLFNGDDFADGFPPAVAELREAIARADGVLIASPEYNYSVPGVLKNAIDYVSRGPDQPFAGKPVAILPASMSVLGGARMQHDLRKTLTYLGPLVMHRPEVHIGSAHTKFQPDGSCTDEPTRAVVSEQMAAFRAWILRVRRMHEAGVPA
jgi:chromate reductase